ncbi:MAG: hypothetical protein AAB554_01715 [Patescibacteria group bacterium]
MEHKPLKIVGVMGLGMVGGSMFRYFEKTRGFVPGKTLFGFDPLKDGFTDAAPLQRADVVFVAVPTPYLTGEDGKIGFDLSYVRKAISSLEGSKIVVIKSTVLPGATDQLQQEFPRHKILFNPEFLTEVSADQDMNYPDRQLIGHTEESYNVATDVMHLLPMAPFERVMPAKEAEMVKYFGNTWFAAKVIFANQMYDMCQAIGVDYDVVKESAAADKRIGRSHLDVFHKGYRGYGGKCLPKDTRALIELGDRLGVEMALLKRVEELNDTLVAAAAAQKASEKSKEAPVPQPT